MLVGDQSLLPVILVDRLVVFQLLLSFLLFFGELSLRLYCVGVLFQRLRLVILDRLFFDSFVERVRPLVLKLRFVNVFHLHFHF